MALASILQACTLMLLAYTMMGGEPAVAVVIFRPSKWALAHATFYGDETASATMGIHISQLITLFALCHFNILILVLYHMIQLILVHINFIFG